MFSVRQKADIKNNGAVDAPGVNPWNEAQDRVKRAFQDYDYVSEGRHQDAVDFLDSVLPPMDPKLSYTEFDYPKKDDK
jgi:hypothetical protein